MKKEFKNAKSNFYFLKFFSPQKFSLKFGDLDLAELQSGTGLSMVQGLYKLFTISKYDAEESQIKLSFFSQEKPTYKLFFFFSSRTQDSLPATEINFLETSQNSNSVMIEIGDLTNPKIIKIPKLPSGETVKYLTIVSDSIVELDLKFERKQDGDSSSEGTSEKTDILVVIIFLIIMVFIVVILSTLIIKFQPNKVAHKKGTGKKKKKRKRNRSRQRADSFNSSSSVLNSSGLSEDSYTSSDSNRENRGDNSEAGSVIMSPLHPPGNRNGNNNDNNNNDDSFDLRINRPADVGSAHGLRSQNGNASSTNANTVGNHNFSQSALPVTRRKKPLDLISINEEIIDLKFPVVKLEDLSEEDKKKAQDKCAICFEKLFEGGKKVRRIELCGHMFHDECFIPWLLVEEICPICRTYLDYYALIKDDFMKNVKSALFKSQCDEVIYSGGIRSQVVDLNRDSGNNIPPGREEMTENSGHDHTHHHHHHCNHDHGHSHSHDVPHSRQEQKEILKSEECDGEMECVGGHNPFASDDEEEAGAKKKEKKVNLGKKFGRQTFTPKIDTQPIPPREIELSEILEKGESPKDEEDNLTINLDGPLDSFNFDSGRVGNSPLTNQSKDSTPFGATNSKPKTRELNSEKKMMFKSTTPFEGPQRGSQVFVHNVNQSKDFSQRDPSRRQSKVGLFGSMIMNAQALRNNMQETADDDGEEEKVFEPARPAHTNNDQIDIMESILDDYDKFLNDKAAPVPKTITTKKMSNNLKLKGARGQDRRKTFKESGKIERKSKILRKEDSKSVVSTAAKYKLKPIDRSKGADRN